MVKAIPGWSSLVSHAPSSCLCRRTAHQLPLAIRVAAAPTIQVQRRHAATYRRHRKLLNIAPGPAHGGSSLPTGSSGRSRSARQPLPDTDHIVFNPPPSAPNAYQTPPKFLPRDDIRRQLLEEENALYSAAPTSPSPFPASSTASTDPTPSRSSGLEFPAPPSSLRKPNSPLNPASSSSSTSASPISATAAHQAEDGLRPSITHTWPQNQELPAAVSYAYNKKYHLGPEEIEQIRTLRQANEAKYTAGKLANMFECSPLFIQSIAPASKERRQAEQARHEKNARNWKKTGQVSLKTREERRRRRAAWGNNEE